MFYLSALLGLIAYLAPRKKGLFSRPTACSGAFFLSVDQKNWNKTRFFRANTSNIHNSMYNGGVLLIQDTLLIWNYWIASPRLLWPASSKRAGFLFSDQAKMFNMTQFQLTSQGAAYCARWFLWKKWLRPKRARNSANKKSRDYALLFSI